MDDLPPAATPRPEYGLTRERVSVFVLAAATALAVYVCYLIVNPFIPVLAFALALAIVARPIHGWCCGRVKNPDVAAGLAVVIVGVFIILPVVFVAQRIGREAVSGAQMVQEHVGDRDWLRELEAHPRLGAWVKDARERLDLGAMVQQVAGFITRTAPQAVAGTAWAVVELFLTLFTLFYFFRDRGAVLGTVRSLLPLSRAEADDVFGRVADVIHATLYGSLAIALVQGALGGLMFWWLGLPSPVVWGAVMALLAVVPNLGTPVVWLPAAAILALTGQWGKATILAAWGATAIGLIDNVLYPYLVGSRMRLHTLAVFFSMLGGLSLMGAAGVVLGPVTLAVTMALLDVWRRRTAGGKPAEAGVSA
jgi:predicted PurR-regulated permease PerM